MNILQKLTANAQSPFIVQIFDCFKVGPFVYIILEFCDSGSLEDYLEKKGGKLDEEDARRILY